MTTNFLFSEKRVSEWFTNIRINLKLVNLIFNLLLKGSIKFFKYFAAELSVASALEMNAASGHPVSENFPTLPEKTL